MYWGMRLLNGCQHPAIYLFIILVTIMSMNISSSQSRVTYKDMIIRISSFDNVVIIYLKLFLFLDKTAIRLISFKTCSFVSFCFWRIFIILCTQPLIFQRALQHTNWIIWNKYWYFTMIIISALTYDLIRNFSSKEILKSRLKLRWLSWIPLQVICSQILIIVEILITPQVIISVYNFLGTNLVYRSFTWWSLIHDYISYFFLLLTFFTHSLFIQIYLYLISIHIIL